jgi:hypothetical protein
MAIRKVGNHWQIDYYDPNGKRIRQNFKKKKGAVAENLSLKKWGQSGDRLTNQKQNLKIKGLGKFS